MGLGGFSTYVLIGPAHSIALILDIITLPLRFKFELLMIAVINIGAAFAFDKFAERPITRLIVQTRRLLRTRRGRRERRHGTDNQYKVIDQNGR